MKTTSLLLIVLPAVAALASPQAFVPPGSLDITFNPGAGADGVVGEILLQPNSKILLAGGFSSFNGLIGRRMVRLETDGRLDTSFDTGIGPRDDGYIYSMAMHPDERIVVAGGFSTWNGIARGHIACLRSDGSLDMSFNPKSGASSYVLAVACQPDGKILLGGTFTTVNGTNRNFLARLTAAGALDLTFNSGSGPDGAVSAIAVQSDGKLLIGGYFASINGTPRFRIARLDESGDVDPTFDAGFIGGTSVDSIALIADKQVLVSGPFTSINGYSRVGIAKLDSQGNVVASFAPAQVAAGSIRAACAQTDGKVIIGGAFSSVGGAQQYHLARLKADGSLDPSFVPNLNNEIYALGLQADGKVVIGGVFTSINSTNINRIARLNGDLTLPADTSLLGLRMYAGLTVFGTVSNTYRIEYAASLNIPRLWTPITNLVLPTSPYLFIDTETPASPARFYRAVALP